MECQWTGKSQKNVQLVYALLGQKTAVKARQVFGDNVKIAVGSSGKIIVSRYSPLQTDKRIGHFWKHVGATISTHQRR